MFAWLMGERDNRPLYPPAPAGKLIYAVGDIHGRHDLLVAVQARIDADAALDPDCEPLEIYLGDYVDRGPSSCDVIDRLLERARSRSVVCLKGNHEAIFESFLYGTMGLEDWRPAGGIETLLSYGCPPDNLYPGAENKAAQADARARVPTRHVEFLSALPHSYELGGYFFVHAGIRPGLPLKAQNRRDLIWIREEFLRDESDHGRIIVHGHTPNAEPQFRINRINIDTGAFATGKLTCLRIGAEGAAILDG